MFVDNPVGLEVNGSLWTLRYEFEMYLMVMVLGLVGLIRRARPVAAAGAGPCLHSLPGVRPSRRLGLAPGVLRHRACCSTSCATPRIFDGRIAAGGARWARARHSAPAVHPALPAVRLLSRALARAQPAPAGAAGRALRRSLLWPLHLRLARGAGGDLEPRRARAMVAGVPAGAAARRRAGLPVVAPDRAAGAPPQAAHRAARARKAIAPAT